MDDDDFGGFEAAESYEFGNGEKQTTSPAIAWAAFPTVSEVHRSTDVLLEHSVPSSCLVPSDSFILSSDNLATAIQTGKSVINPAAPEVQTQADIPVASTNIIEDKTLADVETKRTNEPKSCLQQAVANLEIKLCSAEEEKLKIKKESAFMILEEVFCRRLETGLGGIEDSLQVLQERLGVDASTCVTSSHLGHDLEQVTGSEKLEEFIEKHKQELEDMRKAGHEALTIIVEEFKALLQSTVQQQEAAIEKQYILTIEKHSHKCEELLDAQAEMRVKILSREVLSCRVYKAVFSRIGKEAKYVIALSYPSFQLEKYLQLIFDRYVSGLSVDWLSVGGILDDDHWHGSFPEISLTIQSKKMVLKRVYSEHQRLLDILEAEKEVLSEKTEEAMMQQSKKHKEVLDKCLDEERQRSKESLAAAAKAEKEEVQKAVLKAVEEERRNMEKIHAEERKLWEAERDSHREKIAQAVSEAMQEQRKQNQEIVKEALMEEQKRSEKAIEEAVKRTREELMEYIQEQKRVSYQWIMGFIMK
ncbi:hypothetical protein DUI87_20104 [Hirundo rustica rustica]|uniref:Coiled-coil domain-containing protein 91 n=1 Tax=Hirundo rustica rustica TaxID=333673 RepID=A0A3M0JRH1_HIRRU|nr:hypothetical protein DUI87_20104 [Hirundo rustica rustica]